MDKLDSNNSDIYKHMYLIPKLSSTIIIANNRFINEEIINEFKIFIK